MASETCPPPLTDAQFEAVQRAVAEVVSNGASGAFGLLASFGRLAVAGAVAAEQARASRRRRR